MAWFCELGVCGLGVDLEGFGPSRLRRLLEVLACDRQWLSVCRGHRSVYLFLRQTLALELVSEPFHIVLQSA